MICWTANIVEVFKKITAHISHLAIEDKVGRVKSVATLRGPDISHQHAKE
jgi:hypothetical protein